jgi:hypothetical protein
MVVLKYMNPLLTAVGLLAVVPEGYIKPLFDELDAIIHPPEI